MAVLPFDADPRPVAVALLLFITAAALTIGLLLRRVVDRFCDEDDPRRFYIAQGCSYGGTFIVIAVLEWFRHG